MTANMFAETGYPITVLNGGSAYSTDAVTVWVDWNNNMSFYDAGETFTLTSDGTGASFTGTITPPVASDGSHRMRVRMGYSWTPDPCGETSWGETEDYTVFVTTL
jgi:hypothetical protein